MSEALSLWNPTPARQAILEFVKSVTTPGSPDFIPPEERIAVFDNDGTLWCEKPMYIQLDFLLRKLAEQAKEDPSLQAQQPWQAAWKKDFAWLGGTITKHYQGDDSDLQVLMGGILSIAKDMPVEVLEAEAREFVENVRHPRLGLSYRDCIYRPMLELLQYLEENGFSNIIVSGGGRDFMRGFVPDLYGVPRERIIGSTLAYRFVETGNGNSILQQAELDVVDDGPGKPVQIWNVIGRRPVLAAGNSNGDIEMLKFAQGGGRAALGLLIDHDDPQREYAYTQGSEKALQLTNERKWLRISMRNDWKEVF